MISACCMTLPQKLNKKIYLIPGIYSSSQQAQHIIIKILMRKFCFCNSADCLHKKKTTHIITEFAEENDIILAQLKPAGKSNEITAIPRLLDTLVLKGCIVKIDAIDLIFEEYNLQY